VDYYNSAVNWYESAKLLESNGFYQQSVSQSCLAAELFLKSRLSIIDPNSELDKSHDSINIFNELKKKYQTNNIVCRGRRAVPASHCFCKFNPSSPQARNLQHFSR